MASQPPGSPHHDLIEARMGIRPARPRDPPRARSVTTPFASLRSAEGVKTRGARRTLRAPLMSCRTVSNRDG